MTAPLARTSAEARLYLSLHPCVCGETSPGEAAGSAGDWTVETFATEDGLVDRYVGSCPSCGTTREFLFRTPREPVRALPGEVVFGGSEPSELLDAGEWLWLADQLAERWPVDTTGLGPDQRRQARHDLATAVAAMDEVLKFVPAETEEVPDRAFWTERGQKVRAVDQPLLYRSRLEAIRDAYRDLLATFADPHR